MRAPASLLRSAGNGPSPSPPPLLGDGHAAGEQQAVSVDSDTVVILASLLCALICVAGLAPVARCTCRRRSSGGGGNSNPTAAEVQAPRGLKKAAIEALPTVSLQASGSGRAGEERECAICLVVLAEGDELRLLPLCGHGFHAACIDTWLGAHASCPSCRAAVLTCRRCGAAAAAGDAT
ncbi:RING-H2 finger protein ATL80-like [Panicum miliaceum]|uniref:RING-type E3 ubiquitin transferase n=1 Tax=Panicum miliaceum TaxID=4540 RepID=A0A3L6RR25_PANMI|nr:RING-H2 finger protein ATL80-like [Panicum miliaceum]